MKKIRINSINSLIFILAIVVLGFCIALYFAYNQINAKGEHIVELTEQSAQNSQAQEEMKNLESSLNVIEPQAQKINSYLIAPDGEVDFINQVESLAQADKLKIVINSVAIKNSPDLTDEGMEYLTLRITVDGSWNGSYRFLSELLNLPYQISLTQADLSAPSNTQTSSGWESVFDIQVLKKSSPTS